MEAYNISKHNTFYAIGISYKKADAAIRGKFSLSETAKIGLLTQAKNAGMDAIMATSTCNRTELYGFAQHPFQLIQLLCDNSNGSLEDFQRIGFVYKNKEAIDHLFKVGTGLDSQILGDFEIISQIKQSFTISKKLGLTNHFLERLCNCVIQASKRIKNETELSSGATSVAFASVQYILARVPEVSEKNILLFGTGKIGRNTCENMVKHTRNNHIVLINRTKDKAEKIAGKFNLIVKDYSNLQEEISQCDVLIVATGAQKPTITKELIHSKKELLILDLSIPQNVDPSVQEMPNVTLVHLDQLSQMTNETLKRREQFIPQAEEIIQQVTQEFKSWLETRKFAPTIKALKKKLNHMRDAEIDFQRKKIDGFNDQQAEIISDRIIQKITTQFANHLKDSSDTSTESIELIKKVFQLETL